MHRAKVLMLGLALLAGLHASPPAAALAASSPANVLVAWSNEGGRGHLHVVLDAGAAQTLLWSATLPHPVDAASAGAVGPLGPVVVVGRHAAAGTVLELRALATGTPLCEAPLPWPHLGGYKDHGFGFADVDGAPGQEVLAVGGDHRGGLRTHQWYAFDAACHAVRSVPGGITATSGDPARLDGVAWDDATGDGRADGILMLGAGLYPGGQPRIEIADLAAGTVATRVADTFTGSGMTALAVGRFAGGPGLDFVTGGWWGPMVAAYDEGGTRLWSGDASGSCGSADHVPLLDQAGGALFLGSGSYSSCSPLKVYRADPRTGAVLWSQGGDESARSFVPLAAGDFDGDGDRELVAIHTVAVGCFAAIASYVLDAATGAKLARRCAAPAPDLAERGTRALPAVTGGRDALYSAVHGPVEGCAAGQACVVRPGADLVPLWAVPLAPSSATLHLQAAAFDLGVPEHEQILRAIEALPADTAGRVLPTVVAEHAATRGALASTEAAVLGAVEGAVRDIGVALDRLGDRVLVALAEAEARIAQTLAGMEARLLETLASAEARLQGHLAQQATDTRAAVASEATDTRAAVAREHVATREHVTHGLDALRAAEPLQVALARSAAAEDAGQGPFRVLVTLRGLPTDAAVAAEVDGAPLPAEAAEPLAEGVYRLRVPFFAEPSLLVVRATVGGHAGAAAAWMGPPEPAGGPAPESRWAETVLLDRRVALAPPPVGAAPVALPAAQVEGAPRADGAYGLRVVAGGQELGTLRLPHAGAAPPVALTLAETVALGPFQAGGASVHVRVAYRHDAAAPRCLAELEGACLLVPFDPGSGWLAERGQAASLVVRLRLVAADGAVVEERTAEVPIVGQVLGALGAG